MCQECSGHAVLVVGPGDAALAIEQQTVHRIAHAPGDGRNEVGGHCQEGASPGLATAGWNGTTVLPFSDEPDAPPSMPTTQFGEN